MKKILTMILLFCLTPVVYAAELSGVHLPDSVHLGKSNLVLNGAGVRSKFIFDLYVAALYLNVKKTTSMAVMSDPGEKRIALHLLDDISAESMLYALQKAIEKNHTDEELRAMKIELRDFDIIGHRLGRLREGDVVLLDYQLGTGTQITVNGAVRGTIPGAVFYKALLKIWLGDKPAQEDLKLKLLGGQ